MVMRALDRKLFRDLGRTRAQAAAIALVVAAGVAMFIAMLSTYQSIRASERPFYEGRRLAHVWSGLSRAPAFVVREIAAIPGVAAVEGRIKEYAVLDVPGLAEPASAEIVSIPSAQGHRLNDIYVCRGRHVEPGRPGEVLVSHTFAERNHLALGDTMSAVVAGQRVRLRFVGVARSPEYVMPTAPTGLSADDRRFAVVWMAEDQLAGLTGLRGAVNEVSVRLAPGADERAVIRAMDRVLDRYGGRGAFGRASHPSSAHYEEHVRAIKSLSVMMPTIFLLVAAFLINMVLSRLIATQREQIGLLRAFGYTAGAVGRHYLELAILIVMPGVVLGFPIGAALGKVFADFFGKFFGFPSIVFRVQPAVALGAASVAIVAAALGALGSVRRAARTSPIVAMTPEAPSFGGSLLDRLGLLGLASPVLRLVLRNVSRRPLRSALALVGMSLAVAVVMLGLSIGDSADQMRDVRFQAAERQDVTVTLGHPRALGTVRQFSDLPGVRHVEPMRVVPARVLARGSSEDVLLLGLPAGGVLRNMVDTEYRPSALPPDGAVVTAWLARRFGLRRGDLLTLEIRESRRRSVTVRLVGELDETLGVAVYMDLRALGRLLGEPETYSAANLRVDPARARDLYGVLKRTPAAVAVDFRRGSLAVYRAMGDVAVNFIQRIEVLFGIVIAFGVVYNAAKIALAERSRELATLRVLGFSRAEVSRILLGEIAAIAVPAAPLGFAIGSQLLDLVLGSMASARMHPAHFVNRSTYGTTLVIFAIAVIASALVARRGLDRLDLVGVLKARE